MTLETGLRLLELGIALALIQRGAEHLRREPALFAPQIILAVALLLGVASAPLLCGLWALGLAQLCRFQGPYNGGADKMALLAVTCLMLARTVPATAEIALAYLAFQVTLSYFVSGLVKVRNPDWRSGLALSEVCAFSVYPAFERLRSLSENNSLMRGAARAVIAFELAFPLALLSPVLLVPMLCIAGAFHLANAVLFGLNRFLWIWIATYPSVLWLQAHLIPR